MCHQCTRAITLTYAAALAAISYSGVAEAVEPAPKPERVDAMRKLGDMARMIAPPHELPDDRDQRKIAFHTQSLALGQFLDTIDNDTLHRMSSDGDELADFLKYAARRCTAKLKERAEAGDADAKERFETQDPSDGLAAALRNAGFNAEVIEVDVQSIFGGRKPGRDDAPIQH